MKLTEEELDVMREALKVWAYEPIREKHKNAASVAYRRAKVASKIDNLLEANAKRYRITEVQA